MGEIIKFKSRAELEAEKRQRILDDWNGYVEFERRTLQAVQNGEEIIMPEGKGLSLKEVKWLQDWLRQGFNNK